MYFFYLQEKYEENLVQQETEKLRDMVSRLSDEDKERIREKGTERSSWF